jgi:hypothetical protein
LSCKFLGKSAAMSTERGLFVRDDTRRVVGVYDPLLCG